jgi:hypothetical protein
VATSPSDPLDFLRSLDLTAYRAEDLLELTQRSMQGSSSDVSPVTGFTEAVIRMSGEGVQNNRVGAMEASRVLGGIQEVLSAIGQAVLGQSTTRGQVPLDIRRATSLLLFPAPTTGSVQLHLQVAEDIASLPGLEMEDLAQVSATRLFSLLDVVAGFHENDDEVVTRLKELGPRVAGRLRTLSSHLITDRIDLDLTWRTFAQPPRRARMHRTEAAHLKQAILRHRVDVKRVILVGYLVTVSTVQAASIAVDGGDRVPLEVSSELASTLGRYFDKRVRAETEEVVVHRDTTGRDKFHYRLLSIELATDSLKSSLDPA